MTPSRRPSARPRESIAPRSTQVLIVDDDDMVRRAVTRILRRHHDVVDVRDAGSALALIGAGRWFDAILCDLHLDGMSGKELALHLARTRPSQAERVVILSGSPRSSVGGELLAVVGPRFLEKPATAAEIERILGPLLAADARAA